MSNLFLNEQWISCKIGEEHYAFPLHNISEITPYIKPTPVPGAANEIEGLLNVRGNLITVVSGHLLLGHNKAQHPYKGRIIVFDTPNNLLGICVDSVDESITIQNSDIDNNLVLKENVIIQGTAQNNGNLYQLLDLIDYCRT